MSLFFTSGGQSTGASALVLPLLKMLYLQTESHSEVLKVRASTFTYWRDTNQSTTEKVLLSNFFATFHSSFMPIDVKEL